jgi:hypothetical protein
MKRVVKRAVNEGGSVQGEGDYKSADRYNKSVRSFVGSGKVGDAVKKAAPETPEVEQQLEAAEKVGASHSKGDDPGVKRKTPSKT